MDELWIESASYYCNWATIGNFLMNYRHAVDYLDFDRSILGGRYSLGGGGPMNAGGGQGYILIRFKKGRTLARKNAAPVVKWKGPSAKPGEKRARVRDERKRPGAGRKRIAKKPEADPKGPKIAGAASIDFGRYFALVIGNNAYRYLRPLKTAVHDARTVAKTLREEYGFEVTLLTDATREEVISALDRLRSGLTQRDNLLIYYAGHGVLDKEADRGYWLPVNAKRNSRVEWISTATITDTLKAMTAKHVMVVADSCYSGTLTRDIRITLKSGEEAGAYLARMAKKRSRTVLTSGGLEPVLDSGGGEHSVFAKAFLDALRENGGVMEAQRLFGNIQRPVEVNSAQRPEYSDIRLAGHDGGDFLFVRK
jgi:hypothetical protein